MERPLFLPLCALMAGIHAAGSRLLVVPPILLLPLLLLALATLFLKSRLPFHLVLLSLICLWGNLALDRHLSVSPAVTAVLEQAGDERLLVEGVVESRPEQRPEGGRLLLRGEWVARGKEVLPFPGRVQLLVGKGRPACLTGDRVRFQARLNRPRNFGTPGEFDHERYLAMRGIAATAFVADARELFQVRQGAALPLQRAIDRLALALGAGIERRLPGVDGAILQALLLGDTGRIPQELKDAYSRTGVNHILSISGFHVGIVALFLYQLLYLAARLFPGVLLRCNLRRLLPLVILPVLLGYLFLSGAAPATLRSVLMIALVAAALSLERELDGVNSLILAALAILLVSPAALFDISFQFSFLALWGIIVLTPLLMRPFARLERGIPRKLLFFLMASLAATLATLLPVAHYFHRASLTGLVANFFIVPLMGYGAVVAGFAALPLIPVLPLAAAPLLLLAGLLIRLSNSIIGLLDRIPLLPPFTPSRPELFLALLLLTGLTFLRSARGKGGFCVMVFIAALGMRLATADPAAGRLRFDFLSVGQGESTLIRFPGGRTMLIDGGGRPGGGGWDVGERLLLPALWRLGVSRIDYMVLTHPHPDHMQGLLAVAARLPVGEFWEGRSSGEGEEYGELRRRLAARKVPVRTVGDVTPPLTCDGVTVRALHPPLSARGGVGSGVDPNDESLVMRLEYGPFAALFTGDIGIAAQEELLTRPQLLKSRLFKVPHHGSRHSCLPPFFRAVSPEVAMIGAGYRNSFHLPHRETLDLLDSLGSRVLRTDRDGTISLTVGPGGKTLSVATYNGHFH